MFVLKEYQQKSLDKLEYFLKLCVQHNDVEKAFHQITKESFGASSEYNKADLGNIPYICLRLPTGGGKTILAAKSIEIVVNHFLHIDYPLVIWLVPSTTILEQTYNSLSNPDHPYRRALNDYFKDRIEVLRIEEALSISKGDLEGKVNIIISTYAAWRIEETDSRKVYDNNGSLQSHFFGLSPSILNDLEKFKENGVLKNSLANLVYLNNPLIIIDEAHNARTPLTTTTLKRLNPSCIIEFTATPKNEGEDRSNTIHYVTATELKKDFMIKLPIELYAIPEWHNTIFEAVNKQRELQIIASKEEETTGKYIRPIVLFQAEADRKDKDTITVDKIRDYLIAKCGVTQDQIARVTGNIDEINGLNLLDKNCPITFIITKQKLKEGWDCPFAYIFCTVANTRSSKDVEQLLGRVLRMPYVEEKVNKELGVSYAFAKSNEFSTVAEALEDSLINSGFTKQEANTYLRINAEQFLIADNIGFPKAILSTKLDISRLTDEVQKKVFFNTDDQSLTIFKRITFEEKEEIKKVLTSSDDHQKIENIFNAIHSKPESYKSPYEKGIRIALPQLCINLYGDTILFNEEALLPLDWNLAKCDAVLSEKELPVNIQIGEKGEVDIDKKGKALVSHSAYIQERLDKLFLDSKPDKDELIFQLFKNVRFEYIKPAQLLEFIRKAVDILVEKRNLKIEHLDFVKHQVRDALLEKIKDHIIQAKKINYQTYLSFEENRIKDSIKLTLGPDFEFKENYPVIELYEGSFNFKKHYHKILSHMNGAEVECAQRIDSNPNVAVWLRNLDRDRMNAFSLQTSTDRFYPDFIVKLTNGIIVIVEYKNHSDFSKDDSKEKNIIGLVYAALSNGKCRFIMLDDKDWDSLSSILSLESKEYKK